MENKGTKLCVISLLCMFLAPLVVFMISSKFMSGDISGTECALQWHFTELLTGVDRL